MPCPPSPRRSCSFTGILLCEKNAVIEIHLRLVQALVKEERTPVSTGSQTTTPTRTLWDNAEMARCQVRRTLTTAVSPGNERIHSRLTGGSQGEAGLLKQLFQPPRLGVGPRIPGCAVQSLRMQEAIARASATGPGGRTTLWESKCSADSVHSRRGCLPLALTKTDLPICCFCKVAKNTKTVVRSPGF